MMYLMASFCFLLRLSGLLLIIAGYEKSLATCLAVSQNVTDSRGINQPHSVQSSESWRSLTKPVYNPTGPFGTNLRNESIESLKKEHAILRHTVPVENFHEAYVEKRSTPTDAIIDQNELIIAIEALARNNPPINGICEGECARAHGLALRLLRKHDLAIVEAAEQVGREESYGRYLTKEDGPPPKRKSDYQKRGLSLLKRGWIHVKDALRDSSFTDSIAPDGVDTRVEDPVKLAAMMTRIAREHPPDTDGKCNRLCEYNRKSSIAVLRSHNQAILHAAYVVTRIDGYAVNEVKEDAISNVKVHTKRDSTVQVIRDTLDLVKAIESIVAANLPDGLGRCDSLCQDAEHTVLQLILAHDKDFLRQFMTMELAHGSAASESRSQPPILPLPPLHPLPSPPVLALPKLKITTHSTPILPKRDVLSNPDIGSTDFLAPNGENGLGPELDTTALAVQILHFARSFRPIMGICREHCRQAKENVLMALIKHDQQLIEATLLLERARAMEECEEHLIEHSKDFDRYNHSLASPVKSEKTFDTFWNRLAALDSQMPSVEHTSTAPTTPATYPPPPPPPPPAPATTQVVRRALASPIFFARRNADAKYRRPYPSLAKQNFSSAPWLREGGNGHHQEQLQALPAASASTSQESVLPTSRPILQVNHDQNVIALRPTSSIVTSSQQSSPFNESNDSADYRHEHYKSHPVASTVVQLAGVTILIVLVFCTVTFMARYKRKNKRKVTARWMRDAREGEMDDGSMCLFEGGDDVEMTVVKCVERDEEGSEKSF